MRLECQRILSKNEGIYGAAKRMMKLLPFKSRSSRGLFPTQNVSFG